MRATKIAGKGTGYVAAQAICEGKIVGEEEPFAYAVADDSLKTVCHECFKTYYARANERNRFEKFVFKIETIASLLPMPFCVLLR